MVGGILMIAGVGMFATVSGLAASLFLGARDGKSDELKEVLVRLKIFEAKLKQREAELGLGDQEIVRWSGEIFEAAFRGARQHGQISAEREAQLFEIQDYLNLEDSHVSQVKAEISRSRRLFEIRQGNKPRIQAPNIIMKGGERLVFDSIVK